jgi:hypothetical protein
MSAPYGMPPVAVRVASAFDGPQDSSAHSIRMHHVLALEAGRYFGGVQGATWLGAPAARRQLAKRGARAKLRRAVEVMEPWIACSQALVQFASESARAARLDAWSTARERGVWAGVLPALLAGGFLLLELLLWFAVGFLWGLAAATRAVAWAAASR